MSKGSPGATSQAGNIQSILTRGWEEGMRYPLHNVLPIGMAAAPLHASANPFSLWLHGLEMELLMETRCSLCNHRMPGMARYFNSGTTWLAPRLA